MDKLLLHFRYALGRLKRHPKSAAVVAISIALGITANTTIFSAYRAIVDPEAFAGTEDLILVY